MGTIKKQKFAANRLSVRYGGVPVIYVESEEDQYMFRVCWFRDRLAQVEFEPASIVASSAGCSGVISAVTSELSAGNAAWGIVDRDTVMSHCYWDIADETDDVVYETKKPFGSNIKMLNRWEIENYLIDGESLENLRATIARQTDRSPSEVYQELFGHCQILVPHAAINALLHKCKERGLGDGYTNRFSSRVDVENDIQTNQLPKVQQNTGDYLLYLTQVDAFDYPNSAVEDRVNGLLRRVHGKAVLERFKFKWRISNTSRELGRLLAKRIGEKRRIASELVDFIEQVAATK